jgi:hypothetical protein
MRRASYSDAPGSPDGSVSSSPSTPSAANPQSREDRRAASQANQIQHQIAETVRLAFMEKDQSKASQNERLEQKRIKERILDLATKLSNLVGKVDELKNDKTLAKRCKALETELAKSNAVIAELKEENKTTTDKLAAKIAHLERKVDAGMNSERSKRLSLFNRWSKKHAEDVELLRMSVEESLVHISERSEREWGKQSRALEVLREKIDIALIRRLGYLPTTAGNVGYNPAPPEFHYVRGREVAVEVTEGGEMGEEAGEEEEDDEDLRSKISAFFANSPPRARPSDLQSKQGGKNPIISGLTDPPFQPYPVQGALYNQGMDAHQVINSMESRISEVARHVEEITQSRGTVDSGKELLAERNRRQRKLRQAGNSDDDDYAGSDEKNYGQNSDDEEGKKKKKGSPKGKKKGSGKKGPSHFMMETEAAHHHHDKV